MGKPQVAVFLDRDGVLNRAVVRDGKPYPPATLETMEILPEASEQLSRLREAGFAAVVVTNQPDVARGTQARGEVERMHSAMQRQLAVDAFYVCYHDDSDACGCRKPKPGLLVQAAADMRLQLEGSFLIGDRWRDIEAGQAAGVRTVWIDYGYHERGPSKAADARVGSLKEAVDWILKEFQRVDQAE